MQRFPKCENQLRQGFPPDSAFLPCLGLNAPFAWFALLDGGCVFAFFVTIRNDLLVFSCGLLPFVTFLALQYCLRFVLRRFSTVWRLGAGEGLKTP